MAPDRDEMLHAFRIEDDSHPSGTTVLALHGEADQYVASELRDRLITAIDDGVAPLVLDLSAVTFVDSMTLGVLLGALKRMRARGGELRLVVPENDIRRIFEITMLDRVFIIDRTRSEALDPRRARSDGG